MTTVLSEEVLIDRLEHKIKALQKHLAHLNEKCGDLSLKEYLNPEEVCGILNISSRTLNNYRTKRLISFHQIEYTVWYKPEDVITLLNKLKPKAQ